MVNADLTYYIDIINGILCLTSSFVGPTPLNIKSCGFWTAVRWSASGQYHILPGIGDLRCPVLDKLHPISPACGHCLQLYQHFLHVRVHVHVQIGPRGVGPQVGLGRVARSWSRTVPWEQATPDSLRPFTSASGIQMMCIDRVKSDVL